MFIDLNQNVPLDKLLFVFNPVISVAWVLNEKMHTGAKSHLLGDRKCLRVVKFPLRNTVLQGIAFFLLIDQAAFPHEYKDVTRFKANKNFKNNEENWAVLVNSDQRLSWATMQLRRLNRKKLYGEARFRKHNKISFKIGMKIRAAMMNSILLPFSKERRFLQKMPIMQVLFSSILKQSWKPTR